MCITLNCVGFLYVNVADMYIKINPVFYFFVRFNHWQFY